MDEDDHDELLQCTDDESLSENEEQCLPVNKPAENPRHTLIYFNHTKFEFITTKILLIFSTSCVLILYPLYLDTANASGNAYSIILTSTAVSLIIFVVCMFMVKTFCKKYKNVKILNLPLKLSKMVKLSVLYMICAFGITYSLDRKRVLCHLQDPIKGVVLVCSLLYYFFFCHKFMGLQRIFSATTIIVGLFIAVDYGLCDEFKCRGFERERISDDTGHWSWQVHSAWTVVYIFGLALFAGYFTLLERYLLTNNEMESHPIKIPTALLSTVSRSVSCPGPNSSHLNNLVQSGTADDVHLTKKHATLHLAMWFHVFGLIIAVAMFWTDFIPQLGKGSGPAQSLNFTTHGILCHFQLPSWKTGGHATCGNMFIFSWFFICAYVLFVTTSLKFLILSQSAVYTIATMTSALPIIGIWWSLFYMAPVSTGFFGPLVWSPSVTGEMICSILGLPIILIGLCLLCKSHFKDYQWSRLATTHVVSSNHLA